MEIDYVNQVADNLMIRDSEGVDSVVEKDGGVWRMGFVKYDSGGMVFGGYVNNNSSNNYAGFEGWCRGRFYDTVFSSGEAVDDVFIVHDRLGDGVGEVIGSTWYLGDDDRLYASNEIEFNGVLGDVSQMPVPTFDSSTLRLPHMVVVPYVRISGDANLDGNVDLQDFSLLKANFGMTVDALWEQGDFNGDGAVDLQDFSLLKANFGTDTEPIPEPATLSLLMLGGVALIRRKR